MQWIKVPSSSIKPLSSKLAPYYYILKVPSKVPSYLTSKVPSYLRIILPSEMESPSDS